jgi:hypothetical protein
MEPTRITFAELEEHFEAYVDKAAEGETFVFSHNGKDFILTHALSTRLHQPMESDE